jgi:5-methylcytosine-specific restriction endonuclease McrA
MEILISELNKINLPEKEYVNWTPKHNFDYYYNLPNQKILNLLHTEFRIRITNTVIILMNKYQKYRDLYALYNLFLINGNEKISLVTNYEKIPIPKVVKNKVWVVYAGKNFKCKCYCCQKDINIQNWECGHVESEYNNGSNTCDNLRPICSTCNKSMKNENMIEFVKRIGFSNAPILKELKKM